MSQVKSYRDLIVWQKSMTLVTRVYELTRQFPKEEMYGLTAQIRRSAVSIPSNIAEGHGRSSTGDFVRFLSIATGSLYELETQIQIAANLSFLSANAHSKLDAASREIERMLSSLVRKLAHKKPPPSPPTTDR
jgi:four helix bundle protein